MIKRNVIIARIKPGCEERVAAIFAESDATDLPRLVGVRHRSLFVLDDIYVHLIEMEGDFAESVEEVRNHPLFKEVTKLLEPYIQPINPVTWKSPNDAAAREFYSWDAVPSGAALLAHLLPASIVWQD
jgi:cyclase